ncbi:MAG: Ig-like domain-containing protein [Deltaproteobacteria bacterium]|nr:Ig-like domain-containing protein [Deltaproteobacteria bacterium]
MGIRLFVLLASTWLALFAGCGDNLRGATPPDARIDGPMPDAPPDGTPPDAMITPSQQIADAKATADGTGLSLPIQNVTITYLKPALGNLTNDPAGFTVQAEQNGPAIFVSVDPLTVVPTAAKGDVVSFTITALTTVGGQKRATAISGYTRHSTGANVGALAQNITAATDVVTAINNYDSEIIDVTGTLVGSFAGSGNSFERAQINTTGISGNANYVLRVPSTLRDSLDLVADCVVTLNDTPVGQFTSSATPPVTQAQLAAFTAADLTLTGCPAPTVVSAIALTPTQVRITFSRNILAGSVMADGSQLTFDNGLTVNSAVAPIVTGRTVIVTTSAQTAGTTYTVTVANTVTDLQGTGIAAPGTATFAGFTVPAVVRINEVNANIANGCDLIELRVIESGTLAGFRLQELSGGSGEMVLDLPALTVVKNDIIVVHLDSADTVNCNINGSVNETAIAGQLAAQFPRNYDLAYDLFSTDTGLTATDNVIILFAPNGVMVDAVLIDGDDGASNAASEAAAVLVVTANQWVQVGGGVPVGGYVDADFTAHAVIDSNATTTANHTGVNSESLGRIDDTDDHDKADWAQGLNSWGLINVGQTLLP